jgi:hypothetical protein
MEKLLHLMTQNTDHFDLMNEAGVVLKGMEGM